MNHDYHAHSNYSDGSPMWSMCVAAEEAGLASLGFADHFNAAEREPHPTIRRVWGYNLDLTHERRREAIEALNERFDLQVYDAVEADYDPRDEAEIREFLDGIDFDYAVGSVHELDGRNVHDEDHFADLPEAERREHVERYFEKVVALAESGLFEIAAHVDIVERNAALRGLATAEQYRRVAEALADSRTVPEVNAGRALQDYGEFHPDREFFEVLRDHDLEFVLSTDSHEPDQIGERVEALEAFAREEGVEPVEIV